MRKLHVVSVGALLIGLALSTSSAASLQVKSAKQACAVLKRAAVTYRLSLYDLTRRYYCDYVGSDSVYFRIGLRYRVRPEELVGSNLLGWYGVSRADGAFMEWDLENEFTPVKMGPPFLE
jgi:hypothetical protein